GGVGRRRGWERAGVGDAVIDASVWVSRFVPPDPHPAASARWLAATTASEGLLAAPTLVLPEVAGPIARITGSARLAQRVVARMLGIGGVRLVAVDRQLADGAARLAARLRLPASPPRYVALAERLDLPLVTLDSQQLERGGSVIDVRRPT